MKYSEKRKEVDHLLLSEGFVLSLFDTLNHPAPLQQNVLPNEILQNSSFPKNQRLQNDCQTNERLHHSYMNFHHSSFEMSHEIHSQ